MHCLRAMRPNTARKRLAAGHPGPSWKAHREFPNVVDALTPQNVLTRGGFRRPLPDDYKMKRRPLPPIQTSVVWWIVWCCSPTTAPILPRDALLARYMLSSCVRLSVCLSVTRRRCIKTAERRITQTTPYDSTATIFFWRQNLGEIPTGSPPRGAK